MESKPQLSSTSYYNAIAKGYNALYEQEQVEKLLLIMEYLPTILLSYYNSKKRKAITILDIGCGTGISSRIGLMLQQQNIKVGKIIGIDPAKELLKQNPFPNIVGSAEALPFQDEEFDMVISLTAAQNFSDIHQALLETNRVLKPNGIVVCSILKKSKKKDLFKRIAEKLFTKQGWLEHAKDLIFLGKKSKNSKEPIHQPLKKRKNIKGIKTKKQVLLLYPVAF
ncbi:MAG: class I SAM-dependent methyltransferase [Candidatus Woesearchaeota archaeon]